VLRTFGQPALYGSPVLSPDGHQAAVTIFEPTQRLANIWLFALDTDTSVRFTFGKSGDYGPVWSPDGRQILFSSNRDKKVDLYQKRASGAGAEDRVLESAGAIQPEAWSRDGRFVVFAAAHPNTKMDIWVWPRFGKQDPFPILQTPYDEGQSQLSPDGRFLAYTSNVSGRFEVYVQTFPDPTSRWQVSTEGGADPRWRADGRELFYIAADRSMTAVDVQTHPGFHRGVARALFDAKVDDLWEDTRNHYDVSADGDRFLLVMPVQDPRTTPFDVVVNWKVPNGHERALEVH